MTDDLFDVPPAGFVAARNAKVKELRSAGKADEAQRISGLRKPTPAVFALNQVARHEPRIVEALLEATARLRQVQQARGVPQQAREAMQAHREALARLSQAAAQALQRAGLGGSPALERKVTDTAQGAALTDEPRLRAGTLDAEQAAPGFAAFGSGPAVAIERARSQAAQAASKVNSQRAAAQAQREGMHAKVARAQKAVGEAQERKQREAVERRQKVEERRQEIEARQARDRIEREARVAAQETARLRKRAEAAEKAAARAREAAVKAEQLAREARAAADEAARREASLRQAPSGAPGARTRRARLQGDVQ